MVLDDLQSIRELLDPQSYPPGTWSDWDAEIHEIPTPAGMTDTPLPDAPACAERLPQKRHHAVHAGMGQPEIHGTAREHRGGPCNLQHHSARGASGRLPEERVRLHGGAEGLRGIVQDVPPLVKKQRP